MELLPAERDVRILTRRAPPDGRAFDAHDAVIVICCKDAAPTALRALPHGEVLAREYVKRTRVQPNVSVLSTHLGPNARACIVALVGAAPPFEQLSLGARAWKALAAEAPRRVLLCAVGFEADRHGCVLENFLAAALAGTARMPSQKSQPAPHIDLEAVTLFPPLPRLAHQRVKALDRGNHLARWLSALPPNVLDSASYRRAIERLARRKGWAFTFFDLTALRRQGAGAFLAVARANAHADAGIVRIIHRASDRAKVTGRIALVGKGICFDTGGINLKAHKSMLPMHEDMQGSAVALGTLLALTELEAPFDIECWLAITENNIGPRAFRPQEIVTAANGVTIQVVHSDAEGRLALADTLALAARAKPDLIMDFATLTGACVNALTERFSGVFTNRPQWHAQLESAGQQSGERVWPFPMDEDFDSELESSTADLLQCAVDAKGDHILAARFLHRFVPAEIPWIHLDLAASHRQGGLGHIPTDTTGFGVRFAARLLLEHALLDTGDRASRRTRRAAKRSPVTAAHEHRGARARR